MTPTFDITFQSRSLFDRIQPFLVSLSLTDEPGLKSDRLDLVLSNRGLQLPQTGETLQIGLGYKEKGLCDMGTFVIDGYTLNPTEIRITAHAADFLKNFKNPRSRTFTDTTLENVIQTIASDHGIEAKISSLPSIVLNSLQQSNESDFHFLTRLSNQFNLLLKPAGGALVAMSYVAQGNFPKVTLRPDSVTNWSLQLSKRDETPSVTASGYDIEAASEFHATVGDEGTLGYALRGTYPTREAAQAAAQAVYDKLIQKTYTFSAETIGDPLIMAESILILDGFQNEIPKQWRVSRTTHSLTQSGYRTSVEALLENEYKKQFEEKLD